MPGKGYCPMTLESTTEADEVEVTDTGTVTGFTIITPVQYYGQQETEPFVCRIGVARRRQQPLGGQDIVNIPHAELRVGHAGQGRVEARERAHRGGPVQPRLGWLDGVIDGFEPTGEPDVTDREVQGAHF